MASFFSLAQYKEIANLFSLGEIKKLIHLHQGLQNPKVRIITPKGEFVISKHQLPDKDHPLAKKKSVLQSEIHLLNGLKGLPVPQYVKTARRQWLLPYEGFLVSVYRFIPGKSPDILSLSKIIQLARFLARFHNQGQKIKMKYASRRKFYHLPTQVVKKMESMVRKQANADLRKVIDEVRDGVLKYRPSAKLPQGPIHVDIKPENELFVRDHLTGIIDFGNFYKDALMIDVGKTIMWNCCKNGKIRWSLVEQFWKTYCRYRHVEKQEKEYLLASILYAIFSHIWCDLYHVPLKYVPESYTLFLVREFLPVARSILRDYRMKKMSV